MAMASQNSSLLRPPDWFASMIWRGRETGREYSLQRQRKTKGTKREKRVEPRSGRGVKGIGMLKRTDREGCSGRGSEGYTKRGGDGNRNTV